jgi:hypothetical protein
MNGIRDELNKISGSEADARKQKSRLHFSKGFKVMGEISCVREGKD